MKWIHFDHNGSHFFETKSRNWPFLPKLFNMAQWINIGKYFFKWLSDLFSYCGGVGGAGSGTIQSLKKHL